MRHARHDSTDDQRLEPTARGRHSAAHARGTTPSSSARGASAPARGSSVMPEVDDDEAPRRSSAPASSLHTLSAGQGARITTRKNASKAASNARRRAEQRTAARHPEHHSIGRTVLVVLISIVALLAIVALVKFLSIPSSQDQGTDTQTDETSEPQQVQTSTDGQVSYMGVTYSIEQQDEGYAIVATDSAGSSSVVFTISGEPVALILYNSVIVVPENLSDGTWDVIAYTLGDGSLPLQVTDSSGNPVTGQGTITSATLDGSVVHVTCSDGTTTDVALE
jgi:uncharacterized protein YpmS